MIKLEVEFKSGDGGFSVEPLTYTQLARTESVALYQRSRNGRVLDYEVFKIKVDPKGKTIFSNTLTDDTEKYPSTGQFGRLAWTTNKKKRALELYKKLLTEASAPDTEDEPEIAPVLTTGKEFTTKEFAEQNGVDYPKAFFMIKEGLENGTIKFVREERRNARGKMSKIYIKS